MPKFHLQSLYGGINKEVKYNKAKTDMAALITYPIHTTSRFD